MKSSGFNIEDTHMRDMERIARLVAMVCLALVKDSKTRKKGKVACQVRFGGDFDLTYASGL